MKSKLNYLMTALIVVGFTAGCSSPGKKSDTMAADVKEAKADFLKADKELQATMDKASGYAIFPSVAKGALGVGAATGKGQLFEKGKSQPVGGTAINQVTIGFQAGGQAYSELVLFEDQTTLDNFKKGNFEFSAQATAVALKAGVAANAKYENGVMVFTVARGGLMYEASIGGQKFSYEAY